MSKPIVAIIGRPNVGKSTLFNALAGQQISIVKDTPGVTRDRIYADVNWLNTQFTMIDTGGIEPSTNDLILKSMREQAEIAIETADVIIFLTDVRQGVVDADFVIVLSPRYRNFGVKFSKRTVLACPCRDAVRIHPGMKLESPFVGLLYKETQNIIARIFSGSTGDILTPRLILRLVKGIRHSAYLEEYSIHVIGNQQIQIIRIFLLLSSGIVIFHRPVNAPYGSDPCTAQFFLG